MICISQTRVFYMADGSIPIQLNDLSDIIEGEFLDSEFDRGRYACLLYTSDAADD